jgi:hypothetical protein
VEHHATILALFAADTMRFELEPDNIKQPDESLIADLRRVAALVQPAGITKARYNKYGRWCASTMQKRFGNWNEALSRAGIKPTKLVFISREDIIEDIKAVGRLLGTNTLTRMQYETNGHFSTGPIYRIFDDWPAAARAAGIEPAIELPDVTDELCFETIETVWQRLGRQPRQKQVIKPEAKVSADTITRRFGSWRKALEAFVAFVNRIDDAETSDTTIEPEPVRSSDLTGEAVLAPRQTTSRTAGWKLRFLVMRRDNFRCRLCGKSPANDPTTVLVIDHITAWVKGGPTHYENLQTLCELCNGGKSDLALGTHK